MNIIVVNGTQARMFDGVEPFVTGQSNFDKVGFRFDNAWDGMTKVAQFAQGSNRYNVAVENNECICPSELVEGRVFVRVRGYSDTDVIATANEIQITVEQGFEPGGVPPVPPTPDLYQKLLGTVQDQIGNLDALKTEDKSSLVAAINEIWMSGGGGASVTDAAIDESGHLIITLSTGKTIDAGYAVGPAGPIGPPGENGKNGQDGAPGKDGADGLPGKDGKDGVGIQSVTQTTTSTEDGGTNVVTVTKTDGTTSTFEVRNGSRGSTGPAGADGKNGHDGSQGPAGVDGKTAYQYAQEGGYAGTEQEFAEKMAAEIPEAYTLPIASETTLGGVQPVAKTEAMTQEVGVDAGGALWTAAGGGDPGSNQYKLIAYHKTTDEDVTGTWTEWTYTAYDDGSPLKIRDILVAVQNYKGSGYLYVRGYNGKSWKWVQFWPASGKAFRAEISLMNDFTFMLKSALVSDNAIGFANGLSKLPGLIDKITVGLSVGVTESGMEIFVYGR